MLDAVEDIKIALHSKLYDDKKTLKALKKEFAMYPIRSISFIKLKTDKTAVECKKETYPSVSVVYQVLDFLEENFHSALKSV